MGTEASAVGEPKKVTCKKNIKKMPEIMVDPITS